MFKIKNIKKIKNMSYINGLLINLNKNSSGGGSSPTLLFSQGEVTDTSLNANIGDTSRDYQSQEFTPSWAGTASRNIVRASIRGYRVGTLSGTLRISFFTDNGADDPSSLITAWSDTIDASTVITAEDWIDFDFSTPITLTSGTIYHRIIDQSSDSHRASSYLRTRYVNSGSDDTNYSSDLISWSLTDGTSTLSIRLYE